MKELYVKIVVYTPISHAPQIREVLNSLSGSKMGHYDYCSFSVRGTGRFRPLKGSKPFIGKTNIIEEVEEERIETIALKKDIKKILHTITSVHPYEEPAIDIYPLLYP